MEPGGGAPMASGASWVRRVSLKKLRRIILCWNECRGVTRREMNCWGVETVESVVKIWKSIDSFEFYER